MSAFNQLQILKVARKLIETEDTWTQFTSATNNLGTPVSCKDESAVKFCATGAVHRAYYNQKNIRLGSSIDDDVRNLFKLLHDISKNIYLSSLPVVNDNFGHKDILKVFDIAIEELKAK